MTKAEYSKKVLEIKADYTNRLRQLQKEYCMSIKHCEKGDIIKSKLGRSIIVEGYEVRTCMSLPYLVYRGTMLTKKSEPRKDGRIATMDASEIITINGKKLS